MLVKLANGIKTFRDVQETDMSGVILNQKETTWVVFLCWMQDSNPGSLEPNLQQTEYPLTNQLS